MVCKSIVQHTFLKWVWYSYSQTLPFWDLTQSYYYYLSNPFSPLNDSYLTLIFFKPCYSRCYPITNTDIFSSVSFIFSIGLITLKFVISSFGLLSVIAFVAIILIVFSVIDFVIIVEFGEFVMDRWVFLWSLVRNFLNCLEVRVFFIDSLL